jgi:hypothetical protein
MPYEVGKKWEFQVLAKIVIMKRWKKECIWI